MSETQEWLAVIDKHGIVIALYRCDQLGEDTARIEARRFMDQFVEGHFTVQSMTLTGHKVIRRIG